jgi:hypothetical protein
MADGVQIRLVDMKPIHGFIVSCLGCQLTHNYEVRTAEGERPSEDRLRALASLLGGTDGLCSTGGACDACGKRPVHVEVVLHFDAEVE